LAEAYKKVGEDKIKIPIQCQWRRELKSNAQLYSTFEDIKSNVYQMSADDLGYTIVVHAKADEEDCTDVAIGKFGPISLDIETRKSLESILTQGYGNFVVTNYEENESESKKDPDVKLMLQVGINETTVYMHSQKSETKNKLASAPTTMSSVSVKLHPRESCRFVLYLHTDCIFQNESK